MSRFPISHRRWFFAFALLVGSGTAFPTKHKPTYEELLNSPTRPPIATIAEVEIPEVAGIPLQPQPSHPQIPQQQNRYDFPKWFQIQEKYSPQLIAQMEFVFPGATWAFLGRDTEAHADMVEAFYDSIGQKNRVVRIGISKPTFWDNNGSGNFVAPDSDIVEMLESYGFSLKNLTKIPPFVLVDTLSQGEGRQGRAIIDAVYNTYASQGKNPADLVQRFGMIGLATSTFTGKMVSYLQAKQLFLDTEAVYTQAMSTGQIQTENFYYDKHPMIIFPQAPLHFHECGYEHFTGAWTGRYGALARDSQGRMRAQIAAPNDQLIRQSILWQQRNITKAAASPNFAKRVWESAATHGYTFSNDRPVNKFKPKESPIEAFIQELKDGEKGLADLDKINISELAKTWLELGEQQNMPFPSPAGKALLDWASDQRSLYLPELVSIATFEMLLTALPEKIVTATDIKVAARDALMYARPSLTLYRKVKELVKHSPVFSDLMFDSTDWIAPGGPGYKTFFGFREVLIKDVKEKSCGNLFSNHGQ